MGPNGRRDEDDRHAPCLHVGLVVVVPGAAPYDGRSPCHGCCLVGPRRRARRLSGLCGLSDLVHTQTGLLTPVDSQVYMSLVADVLQCIQWEAQRRVLDMGVMTMQHVYGFLVRVPGRTERVT